MNHSDNKYTDFMEEYDYYPDILTAKEAMEFLGISESLLYKLLNSGEIPGKKIGNKIWRLSKKKLIQYITHI